MKVAIISITRSHLLNLAIQLDNKSGINVCFYTITPARRLREFGYKGKVISFAYPLAFVYLFIHKFKWSFIHKLLWSHKLRKWFDYCCSLFIKPCDILIGANGDAYITSKKAKNKFKSLIICDQGSSHIKAQDAYYKEMNVFTSEWNTQNLLNHYSEADFFMVPSIYVKSTDIENGIDENRILTNPYGVNTNLFKLTDKPSDGSYDVLMVGTWCKRKGCDLLSQACQELDVSLLHVGGITDIDFPKNPKFKHIGIVPEKHLPKYYAMGKVFALTSKNEGMALVTLQATACGLPIVSSKNAGGIDVRNLTGLNEPFFIIDEPLNVENVKKSISNALEYAKKMPSGSRIQYGSNIENITWEAYGNRYYEILKNLK